MSGRRYTLKGKLGALRSLNDFDLPALAVIIGKNGVGKTTLLKAIELEEIKSDGLPKAAVSYYSLESLKPQNRSASDNYDNQAVKYGTELDRSVDGVSLREEIKNIYLNALKNAGKAGSIDGETARKIGLQVQSARHRLSDLLDYATPEQSEFIREYSTFKNALHERERNAKLKSGEGGFSETVLLAASMKKKLVHELDVYDFLKTSRRLEPLISDRISSLYTTYKLEQYYRAIDLVQENEIRFEDAMFEYLNNHPPPWIILDELLAELRLEFSKEGLFSFKVSNPAKDKLSISTFQDYKFSAHLLHAGSKQKSKFESLSSGELVLLSVCLMLFNLNTGAVAPKLLLLDEIDSVLHPAMVPSLLRLLQRMVERHNIEVILTSHSPTTVVSVRESSVFQLELEGRRHSLKQHKMSDVVSSLSSGFMTLEDGLLVLGERYGPITIVSEGNNSIILSKWCELFFPKLKVLKGAESKSGFRQLCTLSHFLDGQNTRHKWLIVVDCDKFGELEKIKSGHAVESFAFDFHENRICKTGIENMFNEDLLKDYARLRTGEKGEALIFESPQKREFANFIKEKGKEEHFVNFLKLKEKVESMLTSVSSENPD